MLKMELYFSHIMLQSPSIFLDIKMYFPQGFLAYTGPCHRLESFSDFSLMGSQLPSPVLPLAQ
jgi:hypothetical protein